MKRFLLILVFLLPMSISGSLAQTDQEQVEAVIRSLFDGMRAKDTVRIAAAFTPEAMMQTIQVTTEGARTASNSVGDFVKRIASTPAETQLDERILDYQIKIDGNLAAAWTPYRFYANEKFSHCGVNSFQLVKFASGWKIVYIIDTRRKEPCEE